MSYAELYIIERFVFYDLGPYLGPSQEKLVDVKKNIEEVFDELTNSFISLLDSGIPKNTVLALVPSRTSWLEEKAISEYAETDPDFYMTVYEKKYGTADLNIIMAVHRVASNFWDYRRNLLMNRIREY